MEIDRILPGVRRLFIGMAGVILLALAGAGSADASAGCNALSGQSFTETDTLFDEELAGGKTFAFEAGDKISITVVAPPDAIVTVKFLDFDETVDNIGGTGDETRTFTFTVKADASARVNISGSKGGGTVKVDFDCVSADDDGDDNDDGEDGKLNADQAGAQVDGVVQQIVPGGIDGDLFGAFGVPLVNLNAAGPNNGLFPPSDCNRAVLKALFDKMEAAKDRLARAGPALAEANEELVYAQHDLGQVDPTYHAAAQNAFARAQRKQEKAAREHADAKAEFAQAKQAFEAQKAACDRARGASNQASAPSGTDGSFAVASALSATGFQPMLLAPASPALLGSDSPGSKSLKGSYSLATARAQGGSFAGLLGDKRFNAWVNGGVVFNENDRRGLGRSGETGVVSGGASYLISPNINVGLAARYGDTDVSGVGGSTDAEAWSGAAFTQVSLPSSFSLAGMLAYTGVALDARFKQGAVTATGKTDADSLAGQLVLSRGYTVHGWTLAPNLGLSFVDIDRDAFTASDGTRVAGSSSTQTSLTAGANLARSFITEGPNGNLITIVPSFGVNGFTNLGLFDPLVGLTGLEFEDDDFGVSLNTGLEVRFQDGASLGLAATFAGVGSDEQNIQLLGGFAVPF